MSIKITSGAALQRMQNGITQGGMTFKHNMESDIRERWALIVSDMIDCRKLAIERNEKQEAIKNA